MTHAGFSTRLASGVALAAMISLGALPGTAEAAILACSSGVAGRVTASGGPVACEVSTVATQDFLNASPMTVNGDGGFFGFTDWQFLGKDETGGQSGAFNVASFAGHDAFGDWMLIFKSGNGTFLTGYLLDATQLAGSWLSPFQQVNKQGRVSYKDVSHISFYARGTAELITPPAPALEVPAPAALALFGLGLAALGVARRRAA